MLILRLLKELGINDVGVYVIASETAKLPDDIVDVLRKTTKSQVYVMLDTDNTGLTSAIEYEKNYGFTALFMTKGYSAKDPTDLVRITDYNFVKKKFANMYLNEIVNGKERRVVS